MKKSTLTLVQLLILSKTNLNESSCKPNNIWVDKGSEFHNRSVKSFLKNNDKKMYSTYNEGKSERFIRTLTNKFDK